MVFQEQYQYLLGKMTFNHKMENKKQSENANPSTSVTIDMLVWSYDNVKNAEVTNKILPCWQIWYSFIFVDTCSYTYSDILSQGQKVYFLSEKSLFSIKSTCC